MAGHPLRPATRRSLGGPLPHQQADRPRAHPSPPELSTTVRCLKWSYSVLAPVSRSYPDVMGRLLTCYSPVRRSCTPKGLTARLACVKHAASVRPEPGSNSPLKSTDEASPNRKTSHRLMEQSRQRAGTPRRETFLHQRNHRQTPKNQPKTGLRSLPTGSNKQTNSSTISTLLSSQGSSAHHNEAFQPRPGAVHSRLRRRSDRRAPERTRHVSIEERWGWSTRGPAARHSALRPAAPWRQREH